MEKEAKEVKEKPVVKEVETFNSAVGSDKIKTIKYAGMTFYGDEDYHDWLDRKGY